MITKSAPAGKLPRVASPDATFRNLRKKFAKHRLWNAIRPLHRNFEHTLSLKQGEEGDDDLERRTLKRNRKALLGYQDCRGCW